MVSGHGPADQFLSLLERTTSIRGRMSLVWTCHSAPGPEGQQSSVFIAVPTPKAVISSNAKASTRYGNERTMLGTSATLWMASQTILVGGNMGSVLLFQPSHLHAQH